MAAVISSWKASFWQSNTITHLTRWDQCEGALTGIAWLWNSYDLIQSSLAVRNVLKKRSFDVQNRLSFGREEKKTLSSMFNWIGSTASFVIWGNRHKLILVEKLSVLLKISMSSRLILSGLNVGASIQSLFKERSAYLSACDRKEKDRHFYYYRLAWMNLAAHVATLAWALLSLISMTTSVILISPILISMFLFTSFGTAAAAIAYAIYGSLKFDPPLAQQSGAHNTGS